MNIIRFNKPLALITFNVVFSREMRAAHQSIKIDHKNVVFHYFHFNDSIIDIYTLMGARTHGRCEHSGGEKQHEKWEKYRRNIL